MVESEHSQSIHSKVAITFYHARLGPNRVALSSRVCEFPNLDKWSDRHTRTELELICWSQMEARAVSSRAWLSLKAKNGCTWQLWAHTCSAFFPIFFPSRSLLPYLLYLLILFLSFNPFISPRSLLSASCNFCTQSSSQWKRRMRCCRESETDLILMTHLTIKEEKEERWQLGQEGIYEAFTA